MHWQFSLTGQLKKENSKFFSERKLWEQLIDLWVKNTLQRAKNVKVFLRNDLSVAFQENFNIKIASSNAKSMKENHLLWQLWAKLLVSFDFNSCGRPLPQFSILDIIFGEYKKLSEFPVRSERTLSRWSKKGRFCSDRFSKKWKCINSLMLILCLHPATLRSRIGVLWRILINFSACNFVKNVTPTQMKFPNFKEHIFGRASIKGCF